MNASGSSETAQIPAGALLIDTDRDQISLQLPRAVLERLDEVLKVALREAGHGSVPRHEIIGALLLDAAADGDCLYELIRGYRAAKVADAVPTGADVLQLTRRKAGRPRNR